jgi:hypothetical protein
LMFLDLPRGRAFTFVCRAVNKAGAGPPSAPTASQRLGRHGCEGE